MLHNPYPFKEIKVGPLEAKMLIISNEAKIIMNEHIYEKALHVEDIDEITRSCGGEDELPEYLKENGLTPEGLREYKNQREALRTKIKKELEEKVDWSKYEDS